MVDDVPMIAFGDVDYGVMSGAGSDGGILLQYFTGPFEWAGDGVTDGVGHGIIGPGPAALGPHEIVFPIFAEHERSFDIVLGSDLLERGSVREIFKRSEVRLQADD